jgi:protein SCO1/2
MQQNRYRKSRLSSRSTTSVAAALIFALSIFTTSLARAHEHSMHDHSAMAAATPAPLLDESIYNLKSTWTTQDRKSIALSSFQGRLLFVAMAYTSCEAACPILVEDMKKIEKALPKEMASKTTFVFVSFDPARDTPERLTAYAKKRHLPLDHWTLLQGSEKSVRDLAAVLGIKFKRDESGDYDHTNAVTLIDQNGLIRHQQVGLNQNPKAILDEAMKLMKGDVK